MSALSPFGFRVALPLSPNGFGRWAVASLLLPLLSLSFLLSPQQASAAQIISQNASSTPDRVSLVLSPASITEAGGTSTVTARLGRASSADTMVTVSAASAYTLGGNADLWIPAGKTESRGLVTITAVDNNVHGWDREVKVSASAANSQGVSGPDGATLTITNDDPVPTVTVVFTPETFTEGGRGEYRPRLSHPSEAWQAVISRQYSIGDGFQGLWISSYDVHVPPGDLVGPRVTLAFKDNDVDAPDAQFGMQFNTYNRISSRNKPTAVWHETLTILDNDGPPKVTLNLSSASIDENGGTSRVTASLSHPSSEDTTVTVSATPVSPAAAGDYRLSSNLELLIPAGAKKSTGEVTITGVDNDLETPDKQVTVSGAAANTQGITNPDATTLTIRDAIRDDDARPTAALSLAPDTIGQSGGMSRVTASLSHSSSEDTTVTVSAAPVPPATSGDYALSSNRQLRIPAGATQSVGLVTVSATSTPTIIDPARRTVTVSATAANGWGVEAPESVALTISGPAWTPFLPPADDASGLEGFVRILNHSDAAGEVAIEAVDDAGVPAGTVTLPIAANAAAHFNSADLERGNPGKGLAEGVGAGQGGWRLVMRSALPITALAYVRTADGLLAPMHDVAPVVGDRRHVAIFNPASNLNQMSRLRLVNLGGREAEVSVAGTDAAGVTPEAAASVAVPAGGAAELTADGLEAALGDGEGKWRLAVRPAGQILAMSLLANPAGHLANLSSAPAAAGDGGAHVVPFLPSASDAFGRQGFVQVANRSAQAGEVTIAAHDDSGRAYEALTLAVGAGATAHFNSDDLELGNADKGLKGSTGPGAGDWRLTLTSGLDLEVLAYVRMSDGFLASMHDVAPTLADGAHWIATFNPASNPNQASSLRLVNPGAADAAVTITGMDDQGASPGAAVSLTVPAGASRTLGAAELESGAEGLEGALGDGTGKWRLRVVSDQPILAMSLVAGPGGRLANLSGAPRRGVR